jgi:2-polyprenyl-6-methoxyphenol hydroxylase-like FAD-dependent oxidoreductase
MINYRPLEWMMVARPWYRGRVLLIGDAAHATTPHMASGAGLAVEDGIVLTLELAAAGTVEQALASFMERRFERARIVVENSVRIGEIEIAGENPMGGAIVMGQTMAAIQAPY